MAFNNYWVQMGIVGDRHKDPTSQLIEHLRDRIAALEAENKKLQEEIQYLEYYRDNSKNGYTSVNHD